MIPRLAKHNIGLAVCTALVCTAIQINPASAQRIRGKLLELQNDRPIQAGTLELLTTDGHIVVRSMTGDDGSFELVAPTTGTYLLKASRIGYQSWIDGPVDIDIDDEYESIFRLQVLPVRLNDIEVSATSDVRYLRSIGFYERQKSDFGHFITREKIAARRATRLSELFQAVPGVRLMPLAQGLGQVTPVLRGSNPSGSGCRPRVYVDGIIFARGDAEGRRVAVVATDAERINVTNFATDTGADDPGFDEIALPHDIEAIEVYRSSSQVPAQFGGASVATSCGVIAIWTRHGR